MKKHTSLLVLVLVGLVLAIHYWEFRRDLVRCLRNMSFLCWDCVCNIILS